MSKPTPIEEWIEEKWPGRTYTLKRQAARETAHHILVELGVIECLERLTEMNTPKDFKSCKGEELIFITAKENCRIAKETLVKLKGEKDE